MKNLFISLGLLLITRIGMAQERPNIVFIISDDHAYQAISAYGSKLAQTPNIDRIANGGARFTNALVTNSICGPSRACFITGKYNHKNGFKTNESVHFDMTQEHFPRLLKNNGYQVAWIGKMHLEAIPQGFDYFKIVPQQGRYYNPVFISPNDTATYTGYISDLITQFTTDWLDKRDTTKPFMLVVGEKATHREWSPDIQDLGAYDDSTFALPPTFFDDYNGRVAAQNQDMTISKTMQMAYDLKIHVDYDKSWVYRNMNKAQKDAYKAYYEDKISREFDSLKPTGKALAEWKYQRYLKDYLSTAKSLDRNVGRILDYLDAHGLSKNTIVVYASDQGFYMGEHGWFDKRFMYEESLKTAFLMRWPGKIKPGSVVNDMVLNIDWGPTLMDAAGLKASPTMQGESFLPIVTGKSYKNWRKAAFYHYYEYPEPHHVAPHFGVRTGKYTLIRFYGPHNDWELYDLKKDPTQVHNVYNDPAYAATKKALTASLQQLIKKYDDKEAAEVLKKEM
ncbi:sulfatase [Chitinophaga caeni]|uniref:Sulfatase n=1 Tax=Chitinophaga caeni TaxID=2029983 RepID=A0A291QQZ7_9BACT|nr:sulfatase [Chitinophaga caeni]ATL46418.1 sulfatase [Chitinophaga caeni]